MGAASKYWAKAEQTAGDAATDLTFDDDLSEVLDDMEEAIDHYIALENKLYKLAKQIFKAGKKVGSAAKSDRTTIREAEATSEGPAKASLVKLGAAVDNSVSIMRNTAINEYMFRTKRELAMARKVIRALK